MAIQYHSDIYLAQLDVVESTTSTAPLLRIFSGSIPANCAAADAGTLLATITLPSDWLAAASGTTKVNTGIAYSGTASGGSGATPTHFRLWNSGATKCMIQGTCGIGSGDLSLNGTITSGQAISIAAGSFTITANNT